MNTENSAHEKKCPHCGHGLSTKEAVTILNGAGAKELVWVKSPDGETGLVDARLVNPSTVEILG